MSNPDLVEGLYPKPKSERAPDYVIGKLSINLEQFMPWVRQWCKDNPGEQWINMELKKRKSDPTKGIAVIDNWKPESKQESKQAPMPESVEDDSLPF